MIYDFGPFMQFVEASTQYTNAVLLAILPYIADFAQKLELRPASEFNTNAAFRVVLMPKAGDIDGKIWFTNDLAFCFSRGHVTEFFSRWAYSKEQNPDAVPRYFAPVRMTEAEAVAMARQAIVKLGYPLKSLFADLEPQITPPEKSGTNVIPFYTVTWITPHGEKAAAIEINGNKKTLESVRFMCRNLDMPPPKLEVQPTLVSYHPFYGTFTGINPEYGYRLLPIVISAVTNYAERMALEVPQPLTTNHIKRFFVGDNGGWPHSELELTNGMRFLYRNTNVVGYFAPDDFFSVASERRKGLLAELEGRWRMTDREMIKLARQTLARLPYRKEFIHTQAQPDLMKPPGQFAKLIPRCKVEWAHPNSANMAQWSYVEIDADKRQVKAIYLDDKSFRDAKPPIDVPITIEEK